MSTNSHNSQIIETEGSVWLRHFLDSLSNYQQSIQEKKRQHGINFHPSMIQEYQGPTNIPPLSTSSLEKQVEFVQVEQLWWDDPQWARRRTEDANRAAHEFKQEQRELQFEYPALLNWIIRERLPKETLAICLFLSERITDPQTSRTEQDHLRQAFKTFLTFRFIKPKFNQ